MSNQAKVNLTEGPILKTLTRLALPIMASSFLATAYNITDMAWIGMLGSRAVAGVGVGGMYVWLSQGLVSLARMGGQVHVAQKCGQEKMEEAENFAAAAIRLTVLFGILFAGVCLFFTQPLIRFFQLNDEQTFVYADVYMKITCGLILFSYLNQTLTGLFTAQGDSKTPFAANLVGLVTNMVLDPLIILGIGPFPRLEVAGAAIATVVAQMLVTVVMFARLYSSAGEGNVIRRSLKPGRTGRIYYREIFRIGVPTALQGTLYCAISMVLTRMVSSFGPGAVASQRVGGQIESIAWNTADGFAAALNAFTGQNYGAGKSSRIREGYRISLRILLLWGAMVTAIFLFLARPMAGIFFFEQEVIEISVDYFRILGVGEAAMCVELMTVGALSGLGKTRLCSIISIVFTGARIPLALFFTGFLGLNGVWMALTVSSIIKGIIFYLTFQKTSRELA